MPNSLSAFATASSSIVVSLNNRIENTSMIMESLISDKQDQADFDTVKNITSNISIFLEI